ncbi:MAG: hypothetical protein ABI824_00005, partial [Acidobacteriota bacterium]
FTRAFVMLLAAAAISVPSQAQQSWDPTGNGLLSGNYNFRETIWLADGVGIGNLSRLVTLTGVINFNGKGAYTISASVADTAASGTSNQNYSGTYTISASGYGFLAAPYITNGTIFGTVANGVFIGSATETGINELFVAAQASSATNANFSGTYTMSYFNFSTGAFSSSASSTAQITSNGTGTINNVAVRSYIGTSGSAINTTETGVKNSFTGGVGTMSFPTSGNPALKGNMDLLLSPDGNLIFGGTHAGFDFYVGVKNAADSPAFKGLYYQAGLDQANSSATSTTVSFGEMDTFYGSFQANPASASIPDGAVVQHQRYFDALSLTGAATTYTATNFYPGNVNSYTDSQTHTEYAFSPNAQYRIGFGQGPYLGLSVAMQVPTFSGSGVYLNPTGVLNGASYAPFTTDIAPGELLVLFGTGLAPGLTTAPSGAAFPQILGNVKVLFNNIPAALYYVSPTQIAVIVPYGITSSIAQIQVVNNNVTSNAVTAFVSATAPGIFSQNNQGVGNGSVLHNADGSLVTATNPAVPGEYIQVYLTGLGSVFPSIADGSPGGTQQLNTVPDGSVVAAFNDGLVNTPIHGTILFAGLAPGYPGLYQASVQVPGGLASGPAFLDIATGDGYTSQVLISLASGASDVPAARSQRTSASPPTHRKPLRGPR